MFVFYNFQKVDYSRILSHNYFKNKVKYSYWNYLSSAFKIIQPVLVVN